MEEFYFSEIIVLYPATLPNNELFHGHFFKVFNHSCRMVYYNGTVTVLGFQKLSGRNGKNILRGEYQKEEVKYEGG